MPVKNEVIFMSNRSGDEKEAWVTLDEENMAKFEGNHELQEFASLPLSS